MTTTSDDRRAVVRDPRVASNESLKTPMAAQSTGVGPATQEVAVMSLARPAGEAI